MFERNTGTGGETATIAVRVKVDTGEVLKGHFITRHGRELGHILNSSDTFLEFVSFKKEHSFLSRDSLLSVEQISEPGSSSQLLDQFKNMNSFNPYSILGVNTEANEDDIKYAYHALLKAYHPDKYSEAGLPSEVVQYLIAMTKRINAAHKQVTS